MSRLLRTEVLSLFGLFALVVSGLACGDNSNSGGDIDAGLPDSGMADATVVGPPYSGVVRIGGVPLNQGTFELRYDGGVIEITTTANGEFSENLPLVDTDYQVYIEGPTGYWGHSSWLLNVSEEGRTGLVYDLADDGFIDSLSTVLGSPSIEKTGGFVSLDIRVGALDQEGLGFTFPTSSDPIFTFVDQGTPLKSATLLGVSDAVLIFTNISPQILPPATPNAEAPGCRQLAPASEVRANTILTLVVSCD